MLLVVAGGTDQASGRQHPEAGQVSVEGCREETRPAHLAVGQDVDASRLLLTDGEIDSIVEQLGDVGRADLPTLGGGQAGEEPGRSGVGAGRARQQAAGRSIHIRPPDDDGVAGARAGSLRVKAKARAGLSTKMDGEPRRDAGRVHHRAELAEQEGHTRAATIRAQ
jgi:hypothetical protein